MSELNVKRCDVCGWPLSTDPAGCRPNDCSMRPQPAIRWIDRAIAPRLTDEQVTRRLAELTTHFGCPVMPISRYCAALEVWRGACEEGARGEPSEHRENRFVEHLAVVFTAIRKSNLLSRLLYDGEQLRTEKCPEHQGRWSGCSPDPCPHGCSSDINITGWLPAVKS